jgi:hypothetical protein
MDLTALSELVAKVHDHSRLSVSDKAYVRNRLPRMLGDRRAFQAIACYSHPAHTVIRGAPARSFVKAYALLLGKKAFRTKRMIGHPFYDDLEKSLTIGIMRSNFEGGRPKGFYCCPSCSLAVFPLLELDLLHYLCGGVLARDMRRRIESGEGPFAHGVADRLVQFTLSFGPG